MILIFNEIKECVKFVVEKYNVLVIYIFGFYVRSEVKEISDIDFVVDIIGEVDEEEVYWNLYGDFFEELKEVVGYDIDLVELEILFDL